MKLQCMSRRWHHRDIVQCPLEFRLRRDSVAKLGCICQRSSSVSFCRALSRSPVEGAAASTHQHQRLTQRLQRASDCDRRWGTAEEVNEPPQVLRGCGEQHLVPRAAQASQSKPVEPEAREMTVGRPPCWPALGRDRAHPR